MSKSIYPERDEKEILQSAVRSPLFPARSQNHLQRFLAAKKLAEEVNSLDILKKRRVEQERWYNFELEFERLRGDLETSRLPGLRGTATRIAQLEHLAQQTHAPQ